MYLELVIIIIFFGLIIADITAYMERNKEQFYDYYPTNCIDTLWWGVRCFPYSRVLDPYYSYYPIRYGYGYYDEPSRYDYEYRNRNRNYRRRYIY